MLTLDLPAVEAWDPKNEEFVWLEAATLKLEHSLYSISKWESKWKKSFISSREKSMEETIDYFRCMSLNDDVDERYFKWMDQNTMKIISDYINDSMTATTITHQKDQKPSREIITAEIVYYWMVALQIPFECQYWHFNKLMTLIEVCNIKNQPPKKMPKSKALAQNRSLNAARRARHHSKG